MFSNYFSSVFFTIKDITHKTLACVVLYYSILCISSNSKRGMIMHRHVLIMQGVSVSMVTWWAGPCWCSRGRACGRRVSGRSVVGAGARNSSYAYEMKVAASWKRAHPQWPSEASLTSTTHSPWIDKSDVAKRNTHYYTPSLTASISTSLHFDLRSRVGMERQSGVIDDGAHKLYECTATTEAKRARGSVGEGTRGAHRDFGSVECGKIVAREYQPRPAVGWSLRRYATQRRRADGMRAVNLCPLK